MNETKGAYLGIDINSKNTVLSIYKSNMDEPTTVSTVLGEENYAIPTVLAKRIGMGQWFFGDEAILKARVKEAVLIEDLFNLALKNEEIFADSETYLARDFPVTERPFELKIFLTMSVGCAPTLSQYLARSSLKQTCLSSAAIG